MITTVTLNPMLDKTVEVGEIRRGSVQRATKVGCIVGGKGVNVSRQIHALGGRTLATGFLGGEIGNMLQRLLDDEGIPHDFVRVRGMTREGVTYLEPDGTWTGVFEPPHRVTGKEGERILNKIDALLPASDYIVCGGSSPGAEVDDLYGEIVTRTNAAGKRSVLDSYGTALTAALRKAPWLVRINKSECEQTLGRTLERDGDFREALRALLEIGVGYCVITDGGRPFFAAGPDGSWRVTPPRIHAVNATGSGDSMLAAFLFGMDKRWDIERCHRFGAAAGAANASKWEVANSTYGEIAAYEASTIVEPLGTS